MTKQEMEKILELIDENTLKLEDHNFNTYDISGEDDLKDVIIKMYEDNKPKTLEELGWTKEEEGKDFSYRNYKNMKEFTYILFEVKKKKICLTKFPYCSEMVTLTKEELQAIYKQIEELGW